MLVGHHKGEVLGACTDCRRLWAEYRAGRIDEAETDLLTDRLAPTKGTCMVMGTASTIACMVEAIGMCLPGAASIPATHADRIRAAEASGAAAVALAKSGRKPSDIMTKAAFRNALTVLQAIGGSTNGLIHFTAIAGRLGIDIDMAEFDRLGLEVPVLVDLKPSGDHYMEHFHWAGAMPKLLKEIADLLDTSALTVTGGTLADNIALAEDVPGQTVIRTRATAIAEGGGLAVLGGNLAPDGALLKRSAATPALMQHEGRAVVFDGLEDMAARLDDPELDVTADDVLVLRNAGPKGAPGMPEAGYIPIPRKLARAGVKDMVRISDARMSGTAFGTIVLHIAPEAAVGGPLGLVKTGDRIRLDAAARRIDLLVDGAELAARRTAWTPPPAHPGAERGYLRLYLDQVTQADQGCDFAFCRAGGASTAG
ncbi:MAG: dihydroxy-acid dehydratase, partial [Acetobacteraceae bacterium SCN 69-10]